MKQSNHKVTDTELLSLVWVNQLSLLAQGVVHNYFGNKKGLCRDDKFWFEAASSEHQSSRQRITDKIGKQQLLKRIRRLIDDGKIEPTHRAGLTFCLSSPEARAAFSFARQFWLDHGVPEGTSNGASNIVKVDGFDELVNKCKELLLLKFSLPLTCEQ